MNHIATLLAPFRENPAGHGVLVLGLGNTLLTDDGVGVHVARQLARDAGTPPWLRPLDGGTLGFRLLDALCGAYGVLIIDAAQMGETAGTIRLFDCDELTRHVSLAGRGSAHEAGLVDLLALARLAGLTHKHLALLGIQPQTVDWGETLSPAVASAITASCGLAMSIGSQWLSGI
jgi:hydrogenase maturation protease